MSFEDDEEANAIILTDFGESYFDDRGNSIFKRHIRIKILDPDNSDFTDVTLRVFREDRAQNLSSLQAQTFNRDENGRVTRDRLGRRDFNSERSGSYEVTRFSFPNVREGSIIEYTYQIMTRNRFRIQDWYFQWHEPVLHSEYRVLIPHQLTFQTYRVGFMPFDKDETVQLGSNAGFYPDTFPSTISVYHRFILNNAPAIRNESHISSRNNYRNRVEFTLSAYLEPNGRPRNLTQSWDDISERLTDIHRFDGQMRSNRDTRELAARLTDGLGTDFEKARALYNYVAREVNWNNRYSIFASDRNGVRDALRNNSGNSAEKAIILINLLRETGIEVNPVLINVRNQGYINWANPSLENFSHLLLKVYLEDGVFLLDPLTSDIPFGMLYPSSLNYEGMVVDGDKWRQIGIDAQLGSASQTVAIANLSEDGSVDLQLQMRYSGYEAIAQRILLRNGEKDTYYRETLLGNNPDIEIISADTQNLDQPEETLQNRLELKSENFAMISGDMMYVNPFMVTQTSRNPFSNRQRNFPVEFLYGLENMYSITLQIPEGFEVDYIPESRTLQLSDNTAFLLQIEQMGNIIQLSTRLIRNDVFFEAEDYEKNRAFYSDIVAINEEQIILSRSTASR